MGYAVHPGDVGVPAINTESSWVGLAFNALAAAAPQNTFTKQRSYTVQMLEQEGAGWLLTQWSQFCLLPC